MKRSAELEIGSVEWHIARCREGKCIHDRVPDKHQIAVYRQCTIDVYAAEQLKKEEAELDRDVTINVLGNRCARRINGWIFDGQWTSIK